MGATQSTGGSKMDAKTSDVEHNKQVVRDQIAAMERLDAAAQSALMTDDVRWWVPQSAVEASGLARPLSGKTAVVELLAGADAFFPEMHWTIDQVVAEGDHVAVHAHMQGRTASGNDYLNYYHFLYRLDGGRIAEVWEHVDTAYAFARMAPKSDETAHRQAIYELLANYGHILDDVAHHRYPEIFTEDALFDMSAYGQPNLNSRAEIAAAFQGRNLYGHLTTNIVIEVLADDSARVRSKFIGFANDGGIHTGDYFDVVVRTGDGWRLKVRKVVPRSPRVFA